MNLEVGESPWPLLVKEEERTICLPLISRVSMCSNLGTETQS